MITGQAHWFAAIFIVLGFVSVGGLLLWSMLADRRYKVESHDQTCPQTGKHVQIVHVRDVLSGRWLGVRSCSSFADPEAVICARDCVKNLNAAFGSQLVSLREIQP